MLLWGYEKNRNTTLVFENNSNEKQKPPFYKTKTPFLQNKNPLFALQKGGFWKTKRGFLQRKNMVVVMC